MRALWLKSCPGCTDASQRPCCSCCLAGHAHGSRCLSCDCLPPLACRRARHGWPGAARRTERSGVARAAAGLHCDACRLQCKLSERGCAARPTRRIRLDVCTDPVSTIRVSTRLASALPSVPATAGPSAADPARSGTACTVEPPLFRRAVTAARIAAGGACAGVGASAESHEPERRLGAEDYAIAGGPGRWRNRLVPVRRSRRTFGARKTCAPRRAVWRCRRGTHISARILRCAASDRIQNYFDSFVCFIGDQWETGAPAGGCQRHADPLPSLTAPARHLNARCVDTVHAADTLCVAVNAELSSSTGSADGSGVEHPSAAGTIGEATAGAICSASCSPGACIGGAYTPGRRNNSGSRPAARLALPVARRTPLVLFDPLHRSFRRIDPFGHTQRARPGSRAPPATRRFPRARPVGLSSRTNPSPTSRSRYKK